MRRPRCDEAVSHAPVDGRAALVGHTARATQRATRDCCSSPASSLPDIASIIEPMVALVDNDRRRLGNQVADMQVIAVELQRGLATVLCLLR